MTAAQTGPAKMKPQPAVPKASKCSACGAAKGKPHADGCPNGKYLDAGKKPADVTLDGKTGSPIVEKKPAKIGDDDRVAPPSLTVQHVKNLTHAIEEREVVGLKQALTKQTFCEEIHLANGKRVGCASLAAFAIVDESSCSECGKMKSKRLKALCITHAARFASGEPIDPQMDLFKKAS